MIIDCISDLHSFKPKLLGGDLLIIAGDLTARDTLNEHSDVLEWINKQKYKKKVLIAGNHDNFLCRNPRFYERTDIDYLCDSGTEFEGFNIWGSPYTARFEGINPKCTAFTGDKPEDLPSHWDKIPKDTDILVTHGPPFGIMDTNMSGIPCGSLSLLTRSRGIPRLKLFVWGHIHEAYGSISPLELRVASLACEKKRGAPTCRSIPWLVNASHVNERYEPVNKPIRVEL